VLTTGPGFPLVASAIFSNDVETFEVLRAHGCDLEKKTSTGTTALDVGLEYQAWKTVPALLKVLSGDLPCPEDSVSLRLAFARFHQKIMGIVSGASMMYPHIEPNTKTPEEFAWMEWVLREGGPIVKPAAMKKLMCAAIAEYDVSPLSISSTRYFSSSTCYFTKHK
jgi:hypothetical protein